jgi:hypothetical protein
MSSNPGSIYAVVENGVVVNLVLWDGDTAIWQPPEGSTAVPVPIDVYVTIGSLYDGTSFSNPTG